MGLGRREAVQQPLFVAAQDLARSPGHRFYERLEQVLRAIDFDRRVEELCAPYYAPPGCGRPSIPPGTYARMILVGYFERLSSQRGIAWKCADSLSVREFVGLGPGDAAPDHSSLTRIRQRLPEEVFEQIFAIVLEALRGRGLLRGKKLLLDSTTLEANAAMRGLRHKVTRCSWREHVRTLAREAGEEAESEEDLRRFDRRRKKKVSNREWESATDPDSRVARMKDKRTHLAYKAEHVVDAESGALVTAAVHPADQGDTATMLPTVDEARENLQRVGVPERAGRELVADAAYHSTEMLDVLREVFGFRTYIAEPKRRSRRRWRGVAAQARAAVEGNRRRIRGRYGREMLRRRAELVEKSFAHLCWQGGGRRVWVRGLTNVRKHYLGRAIAYNLSVLMRHLYGAGTPRGVAAMARSAHAVFSALRAALRTLRRIIFAPLRPVRLLDTAHIHRIPDPVCQHAA